MHSAKERFVGEGCENPAPHAARKINDTLRPIRILQANAIAGQRLYLCWSHEPKMPPRASERKRRKSSTLVWVVFSKKKVKRTMVEPHPFHIQLQRLEKRLAQQKLTLKVDRSAKQLIAKEGYDPQFGARPLKRAIQDHLLDPLATKLLEGEFKPGDRIKVLARNGELESARK